MSFEGSTVTPPPGPARNRPLTGQHSCRQPAKVIVVKHNPQQNAYAERFNRTVRYEWLSQYYWKDLEEVQLFATKWMWSYNHERPNMALGGFTPKQPLAMAA